MAYVYRHIRLDKNEPFYIGIGSDNSYYRANERSRRNPIWENIVQKTDYRVDILVDDISWEEACEIEKWFISFYGRRDNNTGILCNMTDGGDGILGLVFTDEHRKKLSNSRKGRKFSDETKRRIGEKSKGRTLSESARLKISMANKMKVMPESARIKIGNASKGEKNANAKMVLNTQSGIYYGCVGDAAKSIGLKGFTLTQMLNGRRRNKTYFIYA
jgi:hypothetical protein